MASKTEKQRLLSGSLNLLPPGDKIPDGDALQMQNWRADQQGQLRSRKGCAQIPGPSNPSGVFHTLARSGGTRYCGVGTSLYYGIAGPVMSNVLTGFDGNPLGIAFFQGVGWVMNRNQQLRIVGAANGPYSVTKWGIAAPATDPTATAGAQEVQTLNPYNTPNDVTYAGYWSAPEVFQNFPASASFSYALGTVTMQNGTALVTVTGGAFTPAMVGMAIQVTGTKNGELYFFGAFIQSVPNSSGLIMGIPGGAMINYDGDTASGLSYAINQSTPAVSFETNPTQNANFGNVPMVCASTVADPWELVTEFFPYPTTANQDGLVQDSDFFTFPFYADDPTAIESITITLYSNQATYGGQAPTVSVTIPGEMFGSSGSMLNQAHQSYTNIVIRRAVDINPADLAQADNGIDNASVPTTAALQQLYALLSSPHFVEYNGSVQQTGFGPNFIPNGSYIFGGLTFTQGSVPVTGNASGVLFDWTNISGIVITVNLLQPTTFGLGAATATSTLQTGLTGTATYFVQFANAQGENSNPSPGTAASCSVNLNNQGASLSNIATSADPQVTARWIFRIGAGLDQALLVGTIPDNATTTFLDDTTNVEAQNDGIIMQTNLTLPPAAMGVIGPYFGELIAWGTVDHPARYFWTNEGEPWFFPGSDEEDEGNWEDAGSDDDPLLAITNHYQLIQLYKRRSIWQVVGDPNLPAVNAQQLNQNIGVVGPKAVCNGGMVDFFVGPEGVYRHNLYTEEKISPMLDPIFKGDAVYLSNGQYVPPVDPVLIANAVLAVINDRLYFSYTEQGQQFDSVMLVYHIPTNRWVKQLIGLANSNVTALNYEGGGLGLMAGTTSGSPGLLQLETGTGDATSAIPVLWQSRYSDQGLPDNFKWYADLEIDFQTAGINEGAPSTLTVQVVGDDGNLITLGTISSSNRATQGFGQQLATYSLRFKKLSVLISGNVNTTCIIYGVYLHWQPEERVGLVFDAGFTDLGIPERVKQIDYLELQASGTGQALNPIIWSDLPGSQLAQRFNGSLTVPSARSDLRERLTAIAEGRNFRWRTSAASPWQCHKARLRQRVIGEYIDGTLPVPEYYESPEFSVQPGRVGELKDFLLDYDTLNLSTGLSYSGAGTLEIYSDKPGSALSVVRTISIPPRATRSPFVFALEDMNDVLPYGQLFKVRIYPPAGGVMRLHGRATFRARLIGTFFDGSQGETWETQPIDTVGGTGLFREVRFVAQAGGPMNFYVETSTPGQNVTVKSQFTFTTQADTAGRDPIRFRLPGNTRGALQVFRVDGAYWCRLFSAEVYCRGTGSGARGWGWVPIPLPSTPNEFADIAMLVRSTPEAFEWVEVPVDPIE